MDLTLLRNVTAKWPHAARPGVIYTGRTDQAGNLIIERASTSEGVGLSLDEAIAASIRSATLYLRELGDDVPEMVGGEAVAALDKLIAAKVEPMIDILLRLHRHCYGHPAIGAMTVYRAQRGSGNDYTGTGVLNNSTPSGGVT